MKRFIPILLMIVLVLTGCSAEKEPTKNPDISDEAFEIGEKMVELLEQWQNKEIASVDMSEELFNYQEDMSDITPKDDREADALEKIITASTIIWSTADTMSRDDAIEETKDYVDLIRKKIYNG